MKILAAEGIRFEMGVEVDVHHLPKGFDAYCICTGTPVARDLSIPGRELKGIHFALEMLAQQNRTLEGQTFAKDKLVNAKGKRYLSSVAAIPDQTVSEPVYDREQPVLHKLKSCPNRP